MHYTPVLVVIATYKICLAASNDVIAAQQLGYTVSKLLGISRYHLVANRFVKGMLVFGGWNTNCALPLLLLFYFLLVGTSVERKRLASTTIAGLLLIFMIVGYFFVYIITPYDVGSHLDLSLNRLLLQVWPLAIFVYYAIVRVPEQALIAEGVKAKSL